MEAATPWRTRVTWALVGAGVTLAIMSLRERGDDAAEASASSPSEANEVAPTVASREVDVAAPATVPAAAPTPAVTTAEPLPATDDPPLEVPPPSLPLPVEPAASTTTSPGPAPALAASPAGERFEIPLPLMPGARVMKRAQRPDEELGGTIYTLTLSVPAPGMQVESFYRSALADAKLSVSGGGGEPSSIGSGHRSSLRGRGRDASVHVNLHQRAGKLRTTVRIIWRTLP